MKRMVGLFLLKMLFLTQLTLAEPLPLAALPLSAQQIATLRAVQQEDIDNTQLIWKGDPLVIQLPVGQEKRVIFPEPIEVDVNGKLTTDQLRVINNDQNLYLTAQEAFPKTRVYVTLKTSQQVILLDLLTNTYATASTQKITFPEKKENALSTAQSNESITSEKNMSADAYVNAIRFAWQQLYAPQWLLNPDVGFNRTPMHSAFWVPELIYGDKVFAHPQASWQLDGLYVTAVELRNKYPHTTSVKLSQDLCGDWQAATLYPRFHLKPAGEKSGDATTVFLISSKPFNKAMEVCRASA